MKNIKLFDVVILKNKNKDKAVILSINPTNYLAAIFDENGNDIERRIIYDDEIDKIKYSHK